MASIDAKSAVSRKIVTELLNNEGRFEDDPRLRELYIYEGLGGSVNYKLMYHPGQVLEENPPCVVNPKKLWYDCKFTYEGISHCQGLLPKVKLPDVLVERAEMTEEQIDEEFDKWKAQVSKEIAKVVGQGFIGCDDAADWPSRDCFDAGMTPKDASVEWASWQDGIPEELFDMFG